MVLTAGAGRIDFSEASSNSAKWIIKENILLANYEREQLSEAATRRYNQHLMAASGWAIHSEDGKLQEQVSESQKHLRTAEQLMFPWLQVDEKGYYKGFVAGLREEFVNKFGDPDDPETKEKIRRSREQIKRRELEAKQKVEIDRQQLVDRRRRLREKRNRRKK